MKRLLLLTVLLFTAPTQAAIYRWDNGEMIPGTEWVKPSGLNNDLAGIDLSGYDLTRARLNINMPGANLSGTNLTEAYMKDVYLTGANLRGANLTGADLSWAWVLDADMRGVDARGANLGYLRIHIWGPDFPPRSALVDGMRIDSTTIITPIIKAYNLDTDLNHDLTVLTGELTANPYHDHGGGRWRIHGSGEPGQVFPSPLNIQSPHPDYSFASISLSRGKWSFPGREIAYLGPAITGDSNGDDLFNSGDLVTVFTHGFYESGEQAGWNHGDWNEDWLFDSSDFVVAFAAGTYEAPAGAVSAVPEPASLVLLIIGLVAMRRMR